MKEIDKMGKSFVSTTDSIDQKPPASLGTIQSK